MSDSLDTTNTNNVQVIGTDGAAVSFFAEKDRLKDFISSLLGEPQTISKWFEGHFDINKETVRQVYELIEQRMKQQNEGYIVSFVAKTTYNDNTTITHNSINNFISYNEIGPLVPHNLSLTWILLVKFLDKDVPEKQKIEIYFNVHANRKIRIASELAEMPIFYGSPPAVLRIEHTARTWGADIEAMLSKHLNLIVKKEKCLREFVRMHEFKITLLTFFGLIAGSSVAAFYHSKNFINKNIADAAIISGLPMNKYEFIAKRVDYLINIIASGTWSMHIYYLFLYGFSVVIISSVSAFVVSSYADKAHPSFIVLTEKAKEYREKRLNKYKRDWGLFFVSIIAGIGASVVANFIYAYAISE